MYDKWDDELRKALKRPFPIGAVQWKPGATSKDKTRALAMAYVDARSVMERLDRTVGPGNWSDSYEPVYLGEKAGVRCSLTILGVTKQDVGDSSSTGGSNQNELKAAYSDALKRAAVKFGIGRYLYAIPSQWVGYDAQRRKLTEDPQLPSWAIPDGDETGEELSYKEPEPPTEDTELKPREATSTPTGPQQPAAPAKANATTNPGEYVLQYGKKHNGKTLAAIYAEDKDYLAFITGDSCTHPPKPAIIAAIKTYGEWLRGKQRKDTEHTTESKHWVQTNNKAWFGFLSRHNVTPDEAKELLVGAGNSMTEYAGTQGDAQTIVLEWAKEQGKV